MPEPLFIATERFDPSESVAIRVKNEFLEK
jgi:hypothetical protein